jgi:hypothetical protein
MLLHHFSVYLPFEGKDGIRFNNCSGGYYMAFVPSVSNEEFADYCKLLEADGYIKNYENAIKDNVFYNYVNADSGITVYTYRCGHSSEVRIVAGENVPALPEKKEIKKVCEAYIAQLNSSHDVLQLPTVMFTLENVDTAKLYDYIEANPEEMTCRANCHFKKMGTSLRKSPLFFRYSHKTQTFYIKSIDFICVVCYN